MNDVYTLHKMLNEKMVVIPLIQRDYAQGRKDKDYIRRKFLKDICDVLSSTSNDKLTLDFVYGGKEEENFQPLDGQQRLTTLWLVHWYISLKSGHLDEDCVWLKKFTYETRNSSSEFCRLICDIKSNCNITGRISDYIKNQTWFYKNWLQDPTISAMLRTLSGDTDTLEDDCIEGVFSDCDYSICRNKLIQGNIISFNLLEIGTDKLPISDDLYIKMNARGKSLTDFENFKADLVSWINNAQNPDAASYQQVQNNGRTNGQYIISEIDNLWTDVIWKNTKEALGNYFQGKIDDVYFSFINRYILNLICITSLMNSNDFKTEDGKNNNRPSDKVKFEKLYGILNKSKDNKADDSKIKYEDFEVYKEYLTFDTLFHIDKVLRCYSNVNIKNAISDSLDIRNLDDDGSTRGYSFIPVYDSESDKAVLIKTSQKERIYFLAICKFLETIDENDPELITKFTKWMRIVKNITENAGIDSIVPMVDTLRLIDSISTGCEESSSWDIYSYLSGYTVTGDNKRSVQLAEEKEKAIRIIQDPSTEGRICEAERYAFFNGTIRFLFTNDTGTTDWNDFETKFTNAQRLFINNEVQNETIIKLLKLFNGFEEIKMLYLFTNIGYHSRYNCWKTNILTNKDIQSKVHKLLSNQNNTPTDVAYNTFVASTQLIAYIIGREQNYRFKYPNYYLNGLICKEYSQNDAVCVSANRKSKCTMLHNNPAIGVLNDYIDGYYYGKYLVFTYNNNTYHMYEKDDGSASVIKRFTSDKESSNFIEWVNPTDNLCSLIDGMRNWN